MPKMLFQNEGAIVTGIMIALSVTDATIHSFL